MTNINYNNGVGGNKIRFDYSNIGIYNKNRSIKLKNTIKVLDGYSLRKQIENDYKIRVTTLLCNDILETKYLATENLVEQALARNSSKRSSLSKQISDAMDSKSIANRSASSFTSEKSSAGLVNRSKLVQSAPLNRNQVETTRKKSGVSREPSNVSREEEGDEEEEEVLDEKGEPRTLVHKTILRKLDAKGGMSMDVDKWVSIHQRRSKSAIQPRKNAQFSEVKKLNNGSESARPVRISFQLNEQQEQQQQQRAAEQRRENPLHVNKSHGAVGTRSRRELSELTVLDKVKLKNRKLREKNAQEMLKMARKEEFNRIVTRIRDFLTRIEQFKHSGNQVYSHIDLLPQRHHYVKLYEYA